MGYRDEQIADKHYLVYDLEKNDVLDSVTMGMLENNHILGVLKTSKVIKDGKFELHFDTTSKEKLSTLCNRIMNRSQVVRIFDSIVESLMQANEYLIQIGQAVLDVRFIYIDIATGNLELLFLPLEIGEDNSDIRIRLKNILFDLQIDKSGDNQYFFDISNYLNGGSAFRLEEFKKFLEKMDDQYLRKHEEKSSQRRSRNSALYGQNSERTPRREHRPMQAQTVQQGYHPIQDSTPQIQNSLYKQESSPMKTSPSSISMQYSKGNVVSENSLLKEQNTKPSNHNRVEQSDAVEKKKKGLFSFFSSKEKDGMIVNERNHSFIIPGSEQAVQKAEPKKERSNQDKDKSKKSGFSIFNRKKKEEVIPVVPSPQRNFVQPIFPNAMEKQNHEEGNMEDQTVFLSEESSDETILLSGDYETIYNSNAYLIQKRSKEKIFINKSPFRLGKEKNYVDYCITDNPSVSRSHADIVVKNFIYYIVDNNSLNHTYVDGFKLNPGVETELRDGSEIRLSNEEFVFHLT